VSRYKTEPIELRAPSSILWVHAEICKYEKIKKLKVAIGIPPRPSNYPNPQ
jgi:hypothetical protein